MELREPIEQINYRLEKEYGRAFNNSPNFRVVFADDQFEKRVTEYSDEGVLLLMPEVRELPKYRQDDDYRGKYILERYVPLIDSDVVGNMGYEPCWVFRSNKGAYLPPWFDGCAFVIESLYSKMEGAGKTHAKYKDPLATKEAREAKLKATELELFGNETAVGDHLAYGTGLVVPGNNANNGSGEVQ